MSNFEKAVIEVFGSEAFDIINLAQKADNAPRAIEEVSAAMQKQLSGLKPGHEEVARRIAIATLDIALFNKGYEARVEGIEVIAKILGKQDEFRTVLKRLDGETP